MFGLTGVGHSICLSECNGFPIPQIAVQNPLVSERLELSVLYKEYAEDDNIYQQKIKVGAWPGDRKSPRVGAGAWPLDTCAWLGLASEGWTVGEPSGHWFTGWQSLEPKRL